MLLRKSKNQKFLDVDAGEFAMEVAEEAVRVERVEKNVLEINQHQIQMDAVAKIAADSVRLVVVSVVPLLVEVATRAVLADV